MGLRLLPAALLIVMIGIAAPASAKTPPVGALTQLRGADGCIVGSGSHARNCATARALAGPGPFVGSHAVAASPDGHNLYVASASANAIVVFTRDSTGGTLTQPPGTGGCIAMGGADGCATATGLVGPNAVAVSPDGRNVYATARDSNAVVVFARDAATGALTQTGCLSSTDAACTPAGAVGGADTVAVSPDGGSVYVGAFTGNAVSVFARDTTSGALTATGCLSAGGTEGCTPVTGLQAVESVTVSPDGTSVYAAAAGTSTLYAFSRTASGPGAALAPTGCVGQGGPTCTPGRTLQGLNALAVSPDGTAVYGTSVISDGMAIFARSTDGGALTQSPLAAGCLADLPAAACSLARGVNRPEGLGISPDGKTVYIASFGGALAVFDTTNRQLRGRNGCVTTKPSVLCKRGRALLGASSVEVSPDGKFVYVGSYLSSSITVFARATG